MKPKLQAAISANMLRRAKGRGSVRRRSLTPAVFGAAAILAAIVVLASGAAHGQQPAATPARQDVARFAARVDQTLAGDVAGRAHWGILIADAPSGDVLYARNPDSYFQPASNVKLFTTAMALAALGPQFRVRTTIETSGRLERSGELTGDIILVGRGDANLSNHVLPFAKKEERSGPPGVALAQLVDQVVAKGVKQIDGDVVADDSEFAGGRFPPGWTVDDTVWGYGAAVSAIAIDDNEMTLEVLPGTAPGDWLRATLKPFSSVYSVRREGVTTRAKTMPMLRLSRDPDSRVFVVGGTLPVGASPRQLVVGVPQPAEQAAALLAELLQDRRIRVRGRVRVRHAVENEPGDGIVPLRIVLAEHISAPLIDDVRITNKLSINLHAEMMLRVAAKLKANALIMDDALDWASQFRQSIGIAPRDAQLNDGSGLSRSDLATPRAIVQLLEYARRQPWGADFANSLPVAGEDGTLEQRMKGTAADGRVQAKTGYINHSAALSGYAITARGERVVFSIFGTDLGGDARDATSAIDALCVAMIEELGPDPNPSPQPLTPERPTQ